MCSRRVSSGFQNDVSLTQYASLRTRSLKPNASHVSIVRTAMPSACPSCSGARFLLDDRDGDIGECGELRRECQPRRAAAGDQDVDFARDPRLRGWRSRRAAWRGTDRRVGTR